MVMAVIMLSSIIASALPKITVKATGRSQVSMDLSGSKEFLLSDVTLTDDYCVNAFEKEVVYLLSFDVDKLLAGFRETAGLDMKGVKRYAGWESTLIGGHTLGHYLTACVQAYETANISKEDKKALLDKLTKITEGLKECQDALGTGFIFGAEILDKNNVEQQFDNIEKNMTNIITQAWVPWYTMHKIVAGLVSIANITDKDAKKVAGLAKEVVSDLGDWVYGRTSGWSEELHQKVLNIEFGGMNDCMYDVYLLTGKEEHAKAAHAFDQIVLYERVYKANAGDNILNNHHANTTIPKFIGALKRYLVFGEEIYFEYAKKFWDFVVNEHTYVTGGNSEWEHFGLDKVLNAERTNCNCETCNSYNMLKLSMMLFKITGDEKYADWYENTYINSILSSQNPETGMTTYFQPMASGYFKVYGEEFTKFWCCTGSGMENFTKLGESYYFHKEDVLIVNQYFSSILNWEDKKVVLEQKTEIPLKDTAEFTVKGKFKGTIALRLPEWLSAEASVTVDGQAYDYKVANQTEKSKGYAIIEGPFADGTKIVITLPMKVTAHNLPDGENVYAFKYGPVALSALLGKENMALSSTGMWVTIPAERCFLEDYIPSESETVTVKTDTVQEFIDNIDKYLVRDEDADRLQFTLLNTDSNLIYVTHYSQYQERYGLYLKFSDDHTSLDKAAILADKKSSRLENMKLDTVQPGYGQYENDALHNMTEIGNGSTGKTANGTSRYANAGGSFTYTMIVNPEGTDLLATFNAADDGKTLRILAGDHVVYDAVLDSGKPIGYYDVVIPVSTGIIKDQMKMVEADGEERPVVTFTFEGKNNEASAALCNFLYTVNTLSKDTSITSMEINTGSVYYSESKERFLVKVDESVKEVNISVKLPSKYSYMYIDDELTDENKVITLTVNDDIYTAHTITVVAEDHATRRTYDVVIKKQTKEGSDDDDLSGIQSYFVDCGDHGTGTVSGKDKLGTHNSVTEQIYSVDKKTGYKWGVVDDPEDRYNGASQSAGLYTANTWCYEYNGKKDDLSKTETNRYTKNQYEMGIDRHIDYSFELENGTYLLETGFANPWGCSNKPSVYAYYGTDKEQLLIKEFQVAGKTAIAEVVVSGGQLDLNYKSDDKAINVTYISLKPISVEDKQEDYEFVAGTEEKDTDAKDADATDTEDVLEVVPDSETDEISIEVSDNNKDSKKNKKNKDKIYIWAGAIALVVGLCGISLYCFKRKKK